MNVCALNIRLPTRRKQILTGEESGNIITGDTDIILSIIDKSSRQKIDKETPGLTHTVRLNGPPRIQGASHPVVAQSV